MRYIINDNGVLKDKITGEIFEGALPKDLEEGDKYETDMDNRKCLVTVKEKRVEENGALVLVTSGSVMGNA